MKKSKAEMILQAWLELLNYLDRHKVQGRVMFVGISFSLVLLALKYSVNEIVTIIGALK
jgi:hypothetical protein